MEPNSSRRDAAHVRIRNSKAYAIGSGAWHRLRSRTKRACRAEMVADDQGHQRQGGLGYMLVSSVAGLVEVGDGHLRRVLSP